MTAGATLALLGALQGAVLAAVLWRQSGRLPANRWLALLMALAAVRLLNQFAYSSPILGTPITLRFTLPLLLVFTPLVYLYLRGLAAPGEPFRRGDAVHFAPALAVLAYTLPFYWTVPSGAPRSWLAYGQQLRWESTVFNALILAQAAFYLVRTRALLPGYERRAAEVVSNLESARVRWTRWLVWALAGQVALLACVLAAQLLGSGGALVARRDVLLAGFMAFVLYGTGYMALSQSALFADPPAEQPGPKYGRSSLTPARADEAARLIRTVMEKDRLYLDQELTLATLSARLGMPAGQVSQVINERMGQSFHDMVNGYRVEAAKRRLLDPATRQLKVLAVGFEVGFRSKAAFNRIFKLRTGLTPTEFRARGEASAAQAGAADAPGADARHPASADAAAAEPLAAEPAGRKRP